MRTTLAIVAVLSCPALAQPSVEILQPRPDDCVNGGVAAPQLLEPGGEPLLPATDLPLRVRIDAPQAGELEVSVRLGDRVVREARVQVQAGESDVDLPVSADQLVDGEGIRLRVDVVGGDGDELLFDLDRTPPAVTFADADLEVAGTCIAGPAPDVDYDVVDARDDDPHVEEVDQAAGCVRQRTVLVVDDCAFGDVPGNAAQVVYRTLGGPPGAVGVTIEGVDEGARVVSAVLSFTVDADDGCVSGVEATLARDGAPAGFFGQGQRIDQPGSYVATVEATPCGGDPVSAERAFVVVPAPAADTGGPYEVTQGEELLLDGSGSEVAPEFGVVEEYAWDLNADGFFDPEEGREARVPFDTLQGDGVYAVGLRITTDQGRQEFAYTTVTVVDVTPVCDAGGPYEIPQGREVIIDASGSGAGHETEPVIAYDFDFGDDRFPVRGVFPTAGHRYLDEGVFTVTLRVEDIDSFCETTAEVTVVDVEPEIRGFAARAADDLVEGGTVIFTAGLTSAGSAAEPLQAFRWDFGDGSPVESGPNLRDPSHLYVDSGEFEACLEVDDIDSTVRACITIVVADLQPFARLDGPRFALEGTPETFSSRGSRAGGDADPLQRYVWDFGDGSDEVVVEDLEQTEVEHTFISSGELTVTLRVEDEDSFTERTHRIFVADVSPDAEFAVEGGRVEEGVEAVFDASASAGGAASDPIVEYRWDFGDGETAEGPRVTHAWADDGVFLVRLVVIDSDGSQGADERFVDVRNVAPTAQVLTANDQIEVDAETEFRLEFQDVEADVPVIGWRMGDGTQFANVTRVTHAYAATGIYVVRVRLDDGDGGVTEVEHQIEVTGAAPTIVLPANPEGTEDELFELPIRVDAAQIEDGVFDGPVDVQVPVLPRGATWGVDEEADGRASRRLFLRWHPGFGDAGAHRVRIVARAPSGLQRSADVVVVVREAGSAMLAALGSRGDQGQLGLLRLDFDPLRRLDVFETVAEVPLGPGTGALVVSPDGRRLFVSLPGSGAVGVVDPVSGRMLRRIPTGGQPYAMVWAAGAVWAFDGGVGRVWRIDPETLKTGTPDLVAGLDGVLDVAWVGGDFVAVTRGGELRVLDGETREALGVRRVGERLARVLAVEGALHIADVGGRAVLRIDGAPLDGELTVTALDFAPQDLAWIDGAVWVASSSGLTRIDAERAIQRKRDPVLSLTAVPATQLGEPALAVGNSARVTAFTAGDLAEVGAQRGSGARRLKYFVVRP